MLAITRPSNTSPLVSLFNICTRKLSLMDSKSLLDCFTAHCAVFPTDIQVFAIPHQDENLFLNVFQRELLTVYAFFNIEGNSPTPPTFPIPPKNLIAFSGGIPVVRIIPPYFCDSSEILVFQVHCSFSIFVLISHTVWIGIQVLQMDFCMHYLPRGVLPQTARTNISFFPEYFLKRQCSLFLCYSAVHAFPHTVVVQSPGNEQSQLFAQYIFAPLGQVCLIPNQHSWFVRGTSQIIELVAFGVT